MKVAIYARVSTTNHSQDVGLQTTEQHHSLRLEAGKFLTITLTTG
jgi:hypothetical protein